MTEFGEVSMQDELDRHRARIDELDEQILGLLNERMVEALAIGRLKANTGKAVLDSGREKRLLDRLHRLNEGPLSDQDVDSIYQAIMAASRRLQAALKDR